MTVSFKTSELEARVGYSFTDISLLESALTHPSLSYGSGKKKKNVSAYERLEFLGDRVLGLVVAAWLYELFPREAEGDLAKRHASLVNRDALRRVGEELEIEKFLQLAQSSEPQNIRQNLGAFSDSIEAVIGAIYLDGGLVSAQHFIKKFWDKVIHTEAAPADPKSALQEWSQGRGLPLPIYRVVEKAGPPHAPIFKIEAVVQGVDSVICEGTSKREAEKGAAEMLLKEIEKK